MCVCVVRSRDGAVLEDSDKVMIGSSSGGVYTLKLVALTEQDSGQYSVKAINDAGQTACTATLLVHGPLLSVAVVHSTASARQYVFYVFLSTDMPKNVKTR